MTRHTTQVFILALIIGLVLGAVAGFAINWAGEQSPTSLSYSQFSKEW